MSTVAHHAHNGNTPEKRCTGPCQRVLPATTEYFHRERRNTDGLRSECKTCRNHPKDESIPEGYKRCTKCGEVKIASTEYFPRTTHNKEGLSSRCKVCNNALNKAFRENNPEKNKRRMQQWQSTHIEHLREYNQQFKQDNEEYFRSYNRHYRAAHPEQFRARAHKRRALQLGAEGFYTAQDIQAQYQRQRGTCYYCQKRLGKSYHIDHIVPLSRGGANWPDNLVITCPPCNLRKHDKLPHEWAEGGRLLEEVLPYRPLSGASPARGVGSLY